ncbi:MAG: glutamyl-tRNA reductase [Myxococcota bacterium]|nr:glutamyl-tRNA reductase [Myxococcota bacterium]
MRIVLLGMNHRSAPLALRERLAAEEPGGPLQKLVASDEVDEAVFFSTCNRVEVVAVTRSLESARLRLRSFFARDLADEPVGEELDDHLYEYKDADAMRHVLRVASSLDSMVVGEPQILGQAKEAYQRAVECGAAGPLLGRLFQHAFATAKRVRTETRIAERPVSVARVAVDLARQIFEDFSDKQALLIGAGEMIELALESLRGDGLEAIRVVNRTPERAAELAARFGATAHGLDELPSLLREADVVLSSIGGERPILDLARVREALAQRRGLPIFVIDIGVPRNVDPEVNELDSVYLYDIDDLGSVARENAEQRRRETARAEAIVEEQRQRFDGWLTALRAVPTIKHLRQRVERIRTSELEQSLGRLELDDRQREGVEALTRAIVNKILHGPVSRLRQEAEREEGMAYLEAARVLFALDDADPPEEE